MTKPIALITGASSGIGVAYARALATDSDFVLVARRVDRLEALATDLRAAGASVDLLPADLGTRTGLATVVERLAAGDVRILVNSAGTSDFAKLVDVTPDTIDRFLTLNTVAPIELTRAALPGLLEAGDGSIVTVSSLLALSTTVAAEWLPPRTLYAAAKAGILAFTRTLAGELAGTGVRTQVVVPGTVATEFNGGYALKDPHAMSAGALARASLEGLRHGETICIPGLEDQASALEALATAETALMFGGNKPQPAARYHLS